MYDFNGKVALVTGGASGIGFACVRQLLLNGVQGVAIADINEHQASEALKKLSELFGENKILFVKTDVTKHDEFENAFKATYKAWNTLDILINNAGVFDDAHWEFEISINCTAVVRGTLLGFDYMKESKNRKGGIIINMASIYGLQAAPGFTIYSGTKHFVVGMSRSLGSPFYYDNTKVKVLTLCPGLTITGLSQNVQNHILQAGVETLVEEEVRTIPSQDVDNVGNSLIDLINNGSNGSVWVSEGGEPAYEIELPDRLSLRKKV